MILVSEPQATYEVNRASHVTFHSLKEFCESPARYREKRLNPKPRERKGYYLEGEALHCLCLEGDVEYSRRFVVGGPINPRTKKSFGMDSKRFGEWADAIEQETGLTAISLEADEFARKGTLAIRSHSKAAEVLDYGCPELTCRGDVDGVPVQSRIDWIGSHIVDIKTTRELSQFHEDIGILGYVRQLAFYRWAVRLATGHTMPCGIVPLDKKRLAVDWIEFESWELDEAERFNTAALATLRDCIRLNHWPDTITINPHERQWA